MNKSKCSIYKSASQFMFRKFNFKCKFNYLFSTKNIYGHLQLMSISNAKIQLQIFVKNRDWDDLPEKNINDST